jgi:hypothetical protein
LPAQKLWQFKKKRFYELVPAKKAGEFLAEQQK